MTQANSNIEVTKPADAENNSFATKTTNTPRNSKDSNKPVHFFDSKTRGFDAVRSFGVNYKSDLVNITTKTENGVVFGATHFTVLYDYRKNSMVTLSGNKVNVTTISSDMEGNYIATAGQGEDVCVIIWERATRNPICTLFNPHPKYGIAKVALSQNAKYLVTVGCEPKPVVKFWLWTLGNQLEDASYEITSGKMGNVKGISFCPFSQQDFMVTFERHVYFLTWTGNSLSVSTTSVRGKKSVGAFTSSTYINKTHKCVSATVLGWVVVWANGFLEPESFDPRVRSNKMFIKAVRLQNTAVNVIAAVDELLVTGDANGHIKFYDKKLRILYWCQNFQLEAIVSIGFHLIRKRFVFKDPMNFDSGSDDMEHSEDEDLFDDRSLEYERLYAQLVPSDATLQKRPFVVQDFIIMTIDGQIGYVHFLDNKYEVLLEKAESSITAIEVHDDKPLLLLAYTSGRVCSYNYTDFKLQFENKNFVQKSHDNVNILVTCLKFSRYGHFLACGSSNGYLYFLHTVTLEMLKKPYRVVKQAIKTIRFSSNNMFLAYNDESMQVVVFKMESNQLEYKHYSRNIAHSRSIIDIMFVEDGDRIRLFSAGKDRLIIEYDISKNNDGILEILSKHKIEQTAVPRNVLYHTNNNDKYFFIANDQFKFKFVIEEDEDMICRRTILAPTLDESVKQMKITSNDKYLLFHTGQYIGLHIFPPDGNPYKHVSITAHSNKILQFVLCKDEQFVFTIGKDDNCCLMWKINYESTHVMRNRGGRDLEPFGGLVDGGIGGWLFHEMEDLFYYMQIVNQGINCPLPRCVTNTIPIHLLPTLLRAIGFFPTEYELDNLLREVRLDKIKQKTGKDEVTFEEFFKLYTNHKPAFGISLLQLKQSFNNFTTTGKLENDDFIRVLCDKGEQFTENDLLQCLSVLINFQNNSEENKSNSNVLEKLPKKMVFETLMDVLGIDKNKIIPKGLLVLEE